MKRIITNLLLISVFLSASAADWKLAVDTKIYSGDGMRWDEQTGKSLVADFDGDGLLDLYFNGGWGPEIQRNNGNGTFAKMPNIGWLMYDYTDYACNYGFDFNCDGHVDLMSIGRAHGNPLESLGIRARIYINGQNGDNPLKWGWFDGQDFEWRGLPNIGREQYYYDNNGTQTFRGYKCYLDNAAIGDYDHDGYPDVVLVGKDASGNNIARLYHNNGGNNFSEVKIFDTWDGSLRPIDHDVKFADLNNDGWLDIVINGNGRRNCDIYLNDEGKAFYEVAECLDMFAPSRNSGFALNDFNGDGYLDMIMVGWGDYLSNWGSSIFFNHAQNHANKDIIFTNRTDIGSSIDAGENLKLVVRDFNNDGRLDVYKEGADDGGGTNDRYFYYGTSDRAFTRSEQLPGRGGDIYREIHGYGDVTGNGVTDVYVTGSQWCDGSVCKQGGWVSGCSMVFTNIRGGEHKASAQAAPSGVYYSIESDGIVVHWSDVNNLKVGYNVVVETKDGKVFANLPVNTSNSKIMVGEGREVAVRPGVGAIGYKLLGISPSNIKRVGVQTLSIYNETVSPITWAN